MDIYKLYFETLLQPKSICDKIRSFSLSRRNILEGAVLVACLSALLSSAMEKFVFGSTERVNEIFSNSSVTFLFDPFATFFFELLFIFVLILTIFNFGNLSRNKRDVEEVGKLVVWICFVALPDPRLSCLHRFGHPHWLLFVPPNIAPPPNHPSGWLYAVVYSHY